MDLNTLWFLLIAALYIGFFVLEGFDFGVGMLLPFLSGSRDGQEKDNRRRAIINTIGPFWDGNEVWLITAGAATFAAFPHWYATLFSGFYMPLFLLLLALIVRGVAFEFRSKDENITWRKTWDLAVFTGSFVPSLLLGVAFANMVRGVPIDENMYYVGGFFNLLNFYALLGGLTTVLIFLLHGAIFLTLRTTDELLERSRRVALRLWLPVVGALLIFLFATYRETDMVQKLGINPGPVPLTALAAVFLAGYFLKQRREGWAFVMMSVGIASAVATLFMILYPDVLISSINPANNLTIYNASSSPYTLKVMSMIALTLLPFVFLYQGWSYWVLRQRVVAKPEHLTY